jgi:hypothetical protein
MLSELTSLFSLFRHSAKGQGGIIAIAVVILLSIVIAGTSISKLSSLNATRTVVTKQSLQTYYTAEAGIQEAFASRILPRSNYYNFASLPIQYYSRSGRIYTNPADTTRNLIGLYRYVIVGGDPARQSNGNYYPTNNLSPFGIPRLLATDTYPASSPFIVISNGLTCIQRNAKALIGSDQLVFGVTPSCRDNTNFKLDEVTIVAEVNLSQEYAQNTTQPKDRVLQQKIYKNSNNILLASNAFVPGYGWATTGQTLDFKTIWAYNDNDIDHNPLKLNRVVFYNFADNTIYRDITVNNATLTTVPGTIPSNALIRLYFNGPFDYKTLSNTANDTNLTQCKGANASLCNIRVMQNTAANGLGGTVYASNTMIPLFPSSTHVILLPPLTNTLSSGIQHTIRVDTTKMKSFSNTYGKLDYRIVFVTN